MPASVFAALADPTRVEILDRLARGGPQPTGALLRGLPMTRQAAAKHLKALESAGLVQSREKGRQIIRELDPTPLAEAAHWLTARTAAWDEKLAALKRLVED